MQLRHGRNVRATVNIIEKLVHCYGWFPTSDQTRVCPSQLQQAQSHTTEEKRPTTGSRCDPEVELQNRICNRTAQLQLVNDQQDELSYI